MSQKKVEAYKQQKANREQIIKKEKRILMLEKLAAIVIGLVVVCWIGFSVYGKVTGSAEAVQKDTVLNTAAIDDYVSGLSMDAEELEEGTEAEAEVEADADTETDESAE